MDPAPPAEPESEPEGSGFWAGLEPQVKRVILGVGIGALVVGLVGGFAAGFKVEQNRIKTDAKKTTQADRISRLAGVVTAAAPDAITLTDTGGAAVKIATPDTVKVLATSKGKASDITAGGQILLRARKVGKDTEATEIVVLPVDSKFGGLKVSKIAGNKMTVIRSDESTLDVDIAAATLISKAAAATSSDITKGAEIVARGTGIVGSGTFGASEIIVLPPGSSFAASS